MLKAKAGQKSKAFMEKNSWYHRVKILQPDGTVKYTKKGGFATSKEAEKSCEEYEKAFQKEIRAWEIAHKVNTEVVLKDYLLYWFEEVFSPRVEATTRHIGAYIVYDTLLPNMEYDIKLKHVNVEYLDALFSRIEKQGLHIVIRARQMMKVAFQEAMIAGYIRKNPVPQTKAYQNPKPKIMILRKEQIKVLLAAAAQCGWYLEILLALFCGLRKGEILGLKFADFDLEQNTVTVNRQLVLDPLSQKGSSKILGYRMIERDPKSENGFRTLRVPAIVMRELQTRRKRIECDKLQYREHYHDRDYISCQENGLPHSSAAMNIALSKLCSRNGLPHITVHGLRHMFATILLEQGVSLLKISALLGHASVNTTFEYYCDVMDDQEKILAFMNWFFAPMEG